MRRQQRKEATRGNQSTPVDDDQTEENTPLNRPTEPGPDAAAGVKTSARDLEMRSLGEGKDGKELEHEDKPAPSVQDQSNDAVGETKNDGADSGAGAGGAANNRRNRAGLKKPGNGNMDGTEADIENNKKSGWLNSSMNGPFKVLEPIRTDPVKLLQARKNRLERFAVQGIPEIHFVGQISSGSGLIDDATEGVCLRWKVDCGKAWEHLGGDTLGQTQISYCRASDKESIPFNHPLDIHFAAAGMHGWSGAPRIAFQCYKLDWHGRRLLVGYSFEHLPMTPGPHRMKVHLWRPVGSPEQELDAFLLGRVPALTSHEPLYESAWRERCRLVTEAAGTVDVDIFVVTRNMASKGMDN